MATFTRINGFYPNFLTGTLHSTSDLKMFKITVKDGTNTAVDLRDEDGDTLVNGVPTEPGQIVERVISELSPLMYYMPTDNSGVINVVMHGHNVDAASIERRIEQFVDANTTVAQATAFSLT